MHLPGVAVIRHQAVRMQQWAFCSTQIGARAVCQSSRKTARIDSRTRTLSFPRTLDLLLPRSLLYSSLAIPSCISVPLSN
jgi:hypothetical protein